MLQSKYPCMHSFSTNDVLGLDEGSDTYVFKKFINAAIYVEKTISKIDPDLRSTRSSAENMKIMKTKRCSCYIDADSCPCHPSMASGDCLKESKSTSIINNKGLLKELRDLSNSQEKWDKKRKCRGKTRFKPDIDQKIIEELRLKLKDLDDDMSPKPVPSRTSLIENDGREQPEIFQEDFKSRSMNYIDFDTLKTKDEFEVKTCCSATNSLASESGSESSTSSNSSTISQITVKKSDKAFDKETINSDTKRSLSSLTSFTPSENESVRQWLVRKLEEDKKRKLARMKEEEANRKKKEEILERERENFKRWLAAKKVEEAKKKSEMEQQQQLERLKVLEKEKKYLENQIKFQNWLRRKRDQNMGKKSQEELKAFQLKLENERRIEENERAFQEWLKTSKGKPKPIPLNKGLDSLRSSLSVTYVNPRPWVPNVDHKPNSQ